MKYSYVMGTKTNDRRTEARAKYRGLQALILAALASPSYHTPLKLAVWARLLVKHGRAAGLISRRLTSAK